MSVLNTKEYLTSSKETSLQILRYWHQLEFFTPFNLDEVLSGTEIDLPIHVLMDENANKMLPWLKERQELFHYQLYLLPFDKKALTKLSNQHFPLELQNQNIVEIEEKLDDEGLTCFARLFIDSIVQYNR